MAQFLYDYTTLDLTKTLFEQEAIRELNPQRGDMEHLNGIVYADASQGRIIGYKDVRADEFWVSGHIPGRPLLPGVLMIEAGAQLASFYTMKFQGWTGFIGFGGVDECRFRQQVPPGNRMYILGQKTNERRGLIWCKVQGVVNDAIAFEATILGARM
jgi:3-hydroxyacyl-[acyl-carrier-protein] dehydratase